jgi:osmotically-inducible protein OsmY
MLRLLLFLLSVSAGLAQAPPSTDAQIESQLHDRLAKSVIGKDGFTVKVKAGVVTWEGSTTVAQHKGAATRMAKSSGARRVVNNIKVAKGGKKKAGGSPAPQAAPTAVPAPPVAPPKRLTLKWREFRP